MRLTMLAVLLASPLLACQGATGPQGAPGRDGSFKRTPSYCNSNPGVAEAANNWSVSVPCNNQLDIPLSGECFERQTLPAGAFLSAGSPVNWNDTTQIAAWNCQWGWDNGATQVSFLVKAEICCATP